MMLLHSFSMEDFLIFVIHPIEVKLGQNNWDYLTDFIWFHVRGWDLLINEYSPNLETELIFFRGGGRSY